MKFIALLTAILLMFSNFSLWAQLSIEDHLSMERISDLAVKNGKIVVTRKKRKEWNTATNSSLYMLAENEQHVKPITADGYDYSPKWSPKGDYLAFLSYRDGLQQIYTTTISDGKITMVSDAQSYISAYDWVNEHTIAYLDDEPRDSLLVAREKERGGGYIVGTEFITNALWFFDTKSSDKTKITDGSFRIIEFTISPDGKYLGIIAAKNYDTYESITNSWVEVIELNTKRTVAKFNDANAFNHIEFSPRGNYLSFAGSSDGFASNDALFVMDVSNGTVRNLTFEFDPTIGKTQWISNTTLCFSTPKDGYTGIYKADLNGRIDTLIKPYWVIYDFSFDQEKAYFIASRSSTPLQLYQLSSGVDPEKAEQLTQLNSHLDTKIITSSKVINYKSTDGTPVQGIITFPPAYQKDQAYPLMTIPHGGPDALVQDDFNWMGHFFADKGFVVFQPNFRGSIGYGRDFYAGNRNAFGKSDLEDIMSGIDVLIEKGIANEDKLVIGGWSYGGYMANWAITQTDRFKAAISVAGMSNLVSLYGQHEFSNRDIGLWEYKARPVDSVENYRRASPLFFVKNVSTPLLLLHGEKDSRSPTLQAWEMYRAMKDAKKEVEMIIYPGAGHSISRPVQFKSVLNSWLDWSEQHLEK